MKLLQFALVVSLFSFMSSSLFAQIVDKPVEDAPCYFIVENHQKIAPGLVNDISRSLISKYFKQVVMIPSSGVSENECFFRVSIRKVEKKTFATMTGGNNIYGVGESDIIGINGFQVALLKAFINSDRSKKPVLCRDFAKKLKDVCGASAGPAPVVMPMPQVAPAAVDMPEVQASTSTGLRRGICGVWGPNKSYRHCNLKRDKIKGANLAGSDFSGANLIRTKFYNCNLTNVNFQKARLDKAYFIDSKVAGANFSNAIMKATRFDNTNLQDNRFDKARMDKSRLDKIQLTRVSFKGANLYKANFKYSVLKNVDFTGGKLKAAYFQKSTLDPVFMKDVDLSDVEFDGAKSLNIADR